MGKRVDFTTTDERIAWLKSTAARQEISVSQLINRLIRNRMKNEEKFIKKTTIETINLAEANTPKKILSKDEILSQIELEHKKDQLLKELEEEDLPF